MSTRNDVDYAPAETRVRSLWAIASTLTGLGVFGLIASQALYTANGYSYSGTVQPIELTLAQIAASVSPSLLTAGLVCAGLALASGAIVRAMAATAGGTAVTGNDEGFERLDDTVPALSSELGGVTHGSTPADHRLYMRPDE